MGRRSSTRYYNSNGYSNNEELPERGPGLDIDQKIVYFVFRDDLIKSSETFFFHTYVEPCGI